MTWRDVAVICRFAPLKSPLAAAVDPAQAWDDLTYLAAMQTDLAVFDLWRSADPKKRGRQPEPLPRPGQAPVVERTTYEVDGMSFAEADEWLRERHAAGLI